MVCLLGDAVCAHTSECLRRRLPALPALSIQQVLVAENERGSTCTLVVQRGVLRFGINESVFLLQSYGRVVPSAVLWTLCSKAVCDI